MTACAPSARLAVEMIEDWALLHGLVFEHHHLTGAGAVFCPLGTYRYLIWRGAYDCDRPMIGFGMLNPSTAGFEQDDPTSIRCTKRANMMQAGGWIGWNLFALRATDPKVMKRHAAPIGAMNDAAIGLALTLTATTIAAWGTDGAHQGRNADVLRRAALAGTTLHVLGLTKDGHPRHPLYVAGHVVPWIWENTR